MNDLLEELHDAEAAQATIAARVREHLEEAARDGSLGVPMNTAAGRRAVEFALFRLEMMEKQHRLAMELICAKLGRRPRSVARHA